MRVLVVEDYRPLRASLVQWLEEDGYAVDATGDGAEGLWYADRAPSPYDVIILDRMLPGLDGLEVLRRLRAAGCAVPVLILTARDAVADRVEGLDAGADDYLVKPFAMAELRSRLRALVRRSYGRAAPVIAVGPLRIDPAARVAAIGEHDLALTAGEYRLLEYLAQRAGEVLSRRDIAEHLYDDEAEVASNVVDVYVGYLRRKLAAAGAPPLIHTRRGHGYVLGVFE
ncbi:MAG: response regulator transcription factor [Myxococcales bacterium]|nr:response regulator transcription factor [Myxococcales bacterium]